MKDIEYCKNAFADVLLEEMKGQNLNAFSKKLGVPYKTLHHWLKKTRSPSMEYLILLSEKLGLSVDYMLGLRDY